MIITTSEPRPLGLPQASDTPQTHHLVARLLPSAAVFVVTSFVYVLTLSPTVTSEDSGELIGAAYFWGVAHPPGYPLWTIGCGLFLRCIPLYDIAWRCNLFSAVCSAAAMATLVNVLLLTGIRPLATISAALACACGRVLWSQSVITEVYSLHILLVLLVVWCGIRWHSERSDRWLLCGLLVLGLGMSNHQTIGYTGVAVATWAVLVQPSLLRNWRLVLASVLTFAVGLLPYLYIPARAQADPPVNWGNAATPLAAWQHVSRHQYRASSKSDLAADIQPWAERRLGQLRLIGEYCSREYGIPVLVAGVPGVLAMAASRYRWFLLLWLSLVGSNIACHMIATDFGYTTRVDRWCNQVFHLPLYASLAIALAFSLHILMTGLRHLPRNLALILTAILAAAAPATVFSRNLSQNNMRHYYFADDHARNLLDSMLPNAIIFPSGDHNTFPLIYKVLVQLYRTDVTIADKYGYIDLDLYRDMPDNPGKPRTLADRDRIEEWVIRHAKRPVYYTVNRAPLVPSARMVQTGVLYHLLPEGKTIDHNAPWQRIRYRNLDGSAAPRDFGADNILADFAFFRGLRELTLGNRSGALKAFDECALYGDGVKEIFNNIGSALADSGEDEEAIRFYRRAAEMDKRYCPPRWNLARLYKRRGEFAEAESWFSELSQADPKDFRVWGELGFLAARSGRAEAALAHWQESLKLNPAQPQIIEQLYLFHFGGATSKPTLSTNGEP